MRWALTVFGRSVQKTVIGAIPMAAFKRRTAEQHREHLRQLSISNDRAHELLQAQRLAQIAARNAELKGAMVMGMLHAQPCPGTFSTGVYEMLSDSAQQPPESFMRFLRLLCELPEQKAKA